jgi:hypothetical protein
MSYINGPRIVTSGLQLYIDAGNTKSYSGAGSTWLDLTQNTDTFANSYYTYPSSAITGNNRYFNFINNGTTVNNIYNASPKLTSASQRQYTRMAWFNLQTSNSEWSPIIQNSIGNNSDMGLLMGVIYILDIIPKPNQAVPQMEITGLIVPVQLPLILGIQQQFQSIYFLIL